MATETGIIGVFAPASGRTHVEEHLKTASGLPTKAFLSNCYEVFIWRPPTRCSLASPGGLAIHFRAKRKPTPPLCGFIWLAQPESDRKQPRTRSGGFDPRRMLKAAVAHRNFTRNAQIDRLR
jgi:hypothetical protein